MLKFQFNGTKYAIDFTHPIEVERKGGKNVTHRTTKCELLINTSSTPTRVIFDLLATGFSYCHPNDKFDKEIGRKKALKNVFDNAMTPFVHGKDFRKAAWDCYFSRKNTFENPANPKSPVSEPSVSKFSTNHIPSEQPNYWIKVGNLEVAKYPVTVSDYVKFLNATSHPKPANWETQLNNPCHPVVNVSWHDANAYCKWSGTRLPTEIEWVRIAYGEKENQRKFPWGNAEISNFGNFWDTGPHSTTCVWSYPLASTPEGVTDLLGNVWEWTSTLYENNTDFYVARGGSWDYDAANARVSFRSNRTPSSRCVSRGFRCVRDLALNQPPKDTEAKPQAPTPTSTTPDAAKTPDLSEAKNSEAKNSLLKKFTSILEQTSLAWDFCDLYLFLDFWSDKEYREDIGIALSNILEKETFRLTKCSKK